MDTINATNAAMYGDPVKEAKDIRAYVRYRF
jgi:hypothetical protein